MNDNTLVAVSAYAGDLNQVQNNMPLYRHHQCPVVILSPSDAPITAVAGADHFSLMIARRIPPDPD